MVTYRDGTQIPQVTETTEWANLTTGAWSYYDNDQSSNNSSGFNVFPESYRDSGFFYFEGLTTIFWSSAGNGADSAWCYFLDYNYSNLNRTDYDKRKGFSVRFVRD